MNDLTDTEKARASAVASDIVSSIEDKMSCAPESAKYRPGHVYLVESRSGDLVKIGLSSDPVGRIRAINHTSGGVGRRFISPEVKNCFVIEKAFHNKFASNRVTGEWFSIGLGELIPVMTEVCEAFLLGPEDREEIGKRSTERWNSPEADSFLERIFPMPDFSYSGHKFTDLSSWEIPEVLCGQGNGQPDLNGDLAIDTFIRYGADLSKYVSGTDDLGRPVVCLHAVARLAMSAKSMAYQLVRATHAHFGQPMPTSPEDPVFKQMRERAEVEIEIASYL